MQQPQTQDKTASAQTGTLTTGLSSEEAAQRLHDYGPNEPGQAARTSVLVEIAQLFVNPLVLILLAASLVAAVLGEQLNAAIIVAIVVLSAALNFVQVHRSQQAAERLRQQVTPTATVLRDGVWAEVPRREIVPGDMIHLAAGDLVPADAQLVEAQDLHVQQAALILQWDGSTWHRVAPPTPSGAKFTALSSAASDGAGNFWAVGGAHTTGPGSTYNDARTYMVRCP